MTPLRAGLRRGSGDEVGFAIALDSAGNAYVTGDTSSTNFPLEKPLQKNLGGMFDAFVLKLSPAGNPVWKISVRDPLEGRR